MQFTSFKRSFLSFLLTAMTALTPLMGFAGASLEEEFTEKERGFIEKAFKLPYEVKGNYFSATREQISEGLLKPALIASNQKKGADYYPPMAHRYYRTAFTAVAFGTLPVTEEDQRGFAKLIEMTVRGEHRYDTEKKMVPLRSQAEFEADLLLALELWGMAERSDVLKQHECASNFRGLLTRQGYQGDSHTSDIIGEINRIKSATDFTMKKQKADVLANRYIPTEIKLLKEFCDAQTPLKFVSTTMDDAFKLESIVKTFNMEFTPLCFKVGVCSHAAQQMHDVHAYLPETYLILTDSGKVMCTGQSCVGQGVSAVSEDDYLDEKPAPVANALPTPRKSITLADFDKATREETKLNQKVLMMIDGKTVVRDEKTNTGVLAIAAPDEKTNTGGLAIAAPGQKDTAEPAQTTGGAAQDKGTAVTDEKPVETPSIWARIRSVLPW